MCDSNDMEYPDDAGLQGHELPKWLPRVSGEKKDGGKWGVTAIGYGVFLL